MPARISSTAPNWAKALRLWASAVFVWSSWFRLGDLGLLVGDLLAGEGDGDHPQQGEAESAPRTTYGTPPVRILVPSPRRASGGIRLTELHR